MMQQIAHNDQLNEVLESSNKILLTCPRNPDLERLSSLLALHQALLLKDKDTFMFIEGLDSEESPDLPGIEKIESALESRSLELTINYDPSAVEKINYENEKGTFKLYFTPYVKSFNPDQVDIGYTGLDYDLIIVVGAQQLGDLGSIAKQYEETLDESIIVNIDNREENSMFGKLNLIDDTAETISQPIYDTIQALDIPVDKSIATLLLTGLMAKTEQLQKQVSPQLLRFGATLLDKSADWRKARSYYRQPPATSSEKITEVDEPMPEQTSEPQSQLARKIEKEETSTSSGEGEENTETNRPTPEAIR